MLLAWRHSALWLSILSFLLLKPLFPGWHLLALHEARFGDVINTMGLGLFLGFFFLRTLNSGA